ncbi:substrate-binding periplasmic protein [Roseibium sp.]|uniref:substrate-binding periplasmic protein n=1 Tax=Roseibium sp. TaxID=1936156 RepID=UPI003B52E679
MVKSAILIKGVVFAQLLLSLTGLRAEEITTFYQDSYPKYIQTDGGFSGLCMDLIAAVETKIGTKIVNKGVPDNAFRPLKRIQVDIEQGNIDVFFCLAKNSKREKLFDYISTPLYEVNHVVAVRSGEHVGIQNLDDIRDLTSATVLTNFGTATERFLNNQIGLTVDATADSLELNLRKLLLGRGEFVYFHDIGLYSTIRQKFPNEELDVLPAKFRSYYHYLVVSKEAPNGLRETLEKAIRELNQDGTLAKIIKKYKSIKEGPDGS